MGSNLVFETLKLKLQESIIGQEHLVERLLISLLADGHLLVEGAPGLAKTKAIKALSDCLEGNFQRIQFTPDLLPSDVTGTEIYRMETGTFEFQKGPIFHNLVLADEINRAPAKVQSSLLEAMAERQVSVGKHTYPLDDLFLVMATQNPIDQEGTYPLPEAQVDRFMLKTVISYPELDDEKLIMRANLENTVGKVKPVVTVKKIMTAQKVVREVYMDEKIESYILDIIFATRFPEKYNLSELKPLISFGASPRGSINLALAAKCYAFINRRGFVIPDDVRAVVFDVLQHRIGISYEAEAENMSSVDIITKIVNEIEVP